MSEVVNRAEKGSPLPRLPITVHFTPTLEGEVVFNLKCDVKKKMEPLCLNIKANGYSTSVSVRCEHGDGRSTELSTQDINIIDFEEVSRAWLSSFILVIFV